MRTRLLLMGVAGLALALGAGDALSRQAAPPGAKTPAPRFNPAGAPAAQPAGSGIDWKSVIVAQRRGNAAGLGDKLAAGLDQSEVDRTALPILLPTEPSLVASGRLYSFGDYYTLSAEIPGASISFSGTAAPIKVDTPLTVTAEGPENLIIARTVEGHIASYTRYGVLYTVEIACDSPKDDRCVGDSFIRNLAAKTNAVVLGKAARRAAGMGG